MPALVEMEIKPEVKQDEQPIPLEDQLELMDLISRSGQNPSQFDNTVKAIAKLKDLYDKYASRFAKQAESSSGPNPQKSLVGEKV